MSAKKYPEYLDSGVEWLGEVPEHWTICALNYRYEIALGKMLDEKRFTGLNRAPYIRNVDVKWGKINTENLPEMDFSNDELLRYGLILGDLLVCEGGDVGRSAIWTGGLEPCFYQKALHRLRPRALDRDTTRFLYFVFYAFATIGLFSGLEGRATISHLTAEALRRYRFAFPPINEQSAIAAFLDHETGKIDALVAEQRKLISLLKEKRQAVISHAVTKGLNPAAPMKDSGVEWLGEVPDHWSPRRLKHLSSEPITSGVGESGDQFIDGHPRYIRTSDIASPTQLHDDAVRTLPPDIARKAPVRFGDILFSSAGTIGKPYLHKIASGTYCHAGFLVKFSPITDVLGEFILYWAHSCHFSAQTESRSVRSTISNFSASKYSDINLVVPPLPEQYTIVAFLDRETAKIDRLIAEQEKMIALLAERRSALISAAVTGKIDVRGLVPSGE